MLSSCCARGEHAKAEEHQEEPCEEFEELEQRLEIGPDEPDTYDEESRTDDYANDAYLARGYIDHCHACTFLGIKALCTRCAVIDRA